MTSIVDRFTSFLQNPADLFILIFVLCLSLSFHEFSHAWVANRLGDDTAAQQGRLTLNPLKHLDPVGSIVFLIAGIGWARPVPVNPARFSREGTMKSGMMKVSLGGPLANLLLATAASLLFYVVQTIALLVGSTTPILGFCLRLTQYLYAANIGLAVFNLLPMPPLDGFKIFGSLLPNAIYYRILQYERTIGLVFLFLIMFGQGAIGSILSVIRVPFDYVINTPIRFLFSQLWKLIG
jgi:Zn-dependent protease